MSDQVEVSFGDGVPVKFDVPKTSRLAPMHYQGDALDFSAEARGRRFVEVYGANETDDERAARLAAADSTGHMPDGRWAFDGGVTAVFEDMLTRSIPQYEAMRDAVTDLAANYLTRAGSGSTPRLIDLGSSKGQAVQPILDRLGARARYTLTEISEPMLAEARARLSGWIKPGIVEVQELDLRHEFPRVPPVDVVTSVLTLIFVPVEFRHEIVRSAYEALKPGGAMIVVEKLLGAGTEIGRIQRDLYHRMKAANGYSAEAIETKRASMEGVQVCLTDDWNRDLLHAAGFDEVDCFWRWMNFAGYLAVKR